MSWTQETAKRWADRCWNECHPIDDAIEAAIREALEAAARECERLHDNFAGTAEGRGINRGAGLAVERIRALKGTP